MRLNRFAAVLRRAATAVAGGLLLGLGKVVAGLQTSTRIQTRPRPLTADEVTLLRTVFNESIGLGVVRVVEGRAGLFGLVGGRPFTLGNTVYLKRVDPAARPDVLVHECAHVWQYQHDGSRYAPEALWAQWRLPDAYSWSDELSRGRRRWVDFNREAQAQFVQDVFRHGLTDPFAAQTMAYVRNRRPRRRFVRPAAAPPAP